MRFGGTKMSSKKSRRTVAMSKTVCVLIELGECTLHAILRSTADFPKNDLSFERSKDDKTEFDFTDVSLGKLLESIALIAPSFLLTVYVDNTGAVAD